MLEECLDAIIEADTEVLILGTFPGLTSREKKQYYASKKNNFWNTIAKKYNIAFFNDYSHKIKILKQHKIGLCDIIKSCYIEGSSNKTIKNEIYNDIVGFLCKYKNIKKIIINGKSMSKGTKFFVEKYLKNEGINLTIKNVALSMQVGLYYQTHKEEIDKMWLNELPD